MSSRVYFSSWGDGVSKLNMPAYAMDKRQNLGVTLTAAYAVANSIARKNNMVTVKVAPCTHGNQLCWGMYRIGLAKRGEYSHDGRKISSIVYIEIRS